MNTVDQREQEEEWERLYESLLQCVQRFGSGGFGPSDDFGIVDDNVGTRQQKVYIKRLSLLRPQVINAMRDLLKEFPAWEIVVALYERGAGEAWPDMGLILRPHEIIDGLQRHYFPEEFRDLAYEDSRPGTDKD